MRVFRFIESFVKRKQIQNTYMKKILATSVMLFSVSVAALAANAYFIGSCDKDALGYKAGEKMKFSLRVVIEASIDVPGFVRITATPVDEDGKKAKGFDLFDGGACADFDKIVQITPEPADFDAFWKRQLSYLDKVPMKCRQERLQGVRTYSRLCG